MSKHIEKDFIFSLFLLKLFQVISVSAFLLVAYKHTQKFFTLIALLYFLATVGLFFNKRLAWFLSILCPILIFLYCGTLVSYNFLMFFAGHELYKDSPATIFIVAIYGLFTAVPSGIMLFLFWLNRDYMPKKKRIKKSKDEQNQ